MLFHIAEPQDWADAQASGQYRPESLRREGFVHCSSSVQVLATATRYYRGRTGLVLIEVDEAGLDVRWELSTGGERFPHVYGPIPVASVGRVHPFEPHADGTFTLPGT